MHLDDQLRSAANDVRTEIDRIPTRGFEPPSPRGSRVAIVTALLLVVGGGWWLSRPTESDEFVETPIGTADEDAAHDDAAEPARDERPDLITNADPLATSALDRPAFGATVIEPDTGVEVRRITESQPAEAIQPVFAATQTFNADGSLLLLYRTGGGRVGHVVIDAVTGVEVNQLDLADSSDIENIAWDAIEPERLRYQRANEVVTVDVRSGSEESMAIDACERVDNGRSNRSTTSGTALLGLVCHRSDGSTSWIVVDTSTDQVVAERPSEIAEPPVALVSGNGFVVVDVDRVIHLDPELQTLGEIPIEASSWAVATDSDGSDLLVATVFGGPTEVGSVVVVDLATAEVRTIVGPETGYPYPPSGTQLSTAATGQPQLVAITTNDSAGGVLANEVMLLRLDGDGSSLIRLAHHRSSGTDVGDWPGHSMVAISPDGSTVLFSSDWGTDAIDTYAIDLTGMVDLGS